MVDYVLVAARVRAAFDQQHMEHIKPRACGTAPPVPRVSSSEQDIEYEGYESKRT